ncbi:MAG: Mur ligase family protein [Patescibacteria group bacterium]
MPLQSSLETFLGACAKRALRREKPTVIAVAGSVGKTSTKAAIAIALGAGEKGSDVAASEKNYNNELGVPLTIFGCDAPHRSPLRWMVLLSKAWLTSVGWMRLRAKVFVLEMATDKPGDLAYLLDIAPPSIGVLTAIGAEHTEFFGSIEAVAKEEAAVLDALLEDGMAIVNADDPLVHEAALRTKAQYVSFGMSDSAMSRIVSSSVAIDETHPETSGLTVRISLYGAVSTLHLAGCVGRAQTYAVAAALAVCATFDHDIDAAIQRLESSFKMPGRMRLLEGIKRTWLIDDTYNSSTLAALSAIRDLAAFPITSPGRRIAALGDMLELGALAEDAHREMGHAAAEAGIDMLIACGTLAHVTAQGARDAGMSDDRIFVFAKSPEVGLFIQERLKEHDVVLIKGSQGIRMERVTKELMAHPDKAEELLVRQSPDWLAKP